MHKVSISGTMADRVRNKGLCVICDVCAAIQSVPGRTSKSHYTVEDEAEVVAHATAAGWKTKVNSDEKDLCPNCAVAPTYHDVEVTIDSTVYKITDNYHLLLTCSRTAGWELWRTYNEGQPTLLGCEFGDKDFRIQIRGVTVCERKSLANEAKLVTQVTTKAEHANAVEILQRVLDVTGGKTDHALTAEALRIGDLIEPYEDKHFPIAT